MAHTQKTADWTVMTYYTCPKKPSIEGISFIIGGISRQSPCTREQALENAISDIRSKYEASDEIEVFELQYDPKIDRLVNVDFEAIKNLPENTVFFSLYNSNDKAIDSGIERRKQAPIPPRRPTKLKAFEDFPDWIKKKIVVIPSGCWLWTGSINEQGYGKLTYEEESWPAHRFTYCYSAGYLDSKFLLRHECDNRMCVAPHHLIPGNVYTNADDVISRDRMNTKKFGSSMFLDESLILEDVREIRIKYFVNERPIRSLAREYKIGDNMIKSIVNFKIKFR